jgi:hypothetical protein
MQVQRMVAGFGVFMLVILFLMLLRANLRKPPPPLVFPPPPTRPEPEKPPELLPHPKVEVEPPPKVLPDPVVPYIPTPELVVINMLTMANVKKGDILYDLGSGDGRIVILAAKQFGARAFGYEIDPALVKKSREAITKQKLEKTATVEQRNIYRLDLSGGTVITLYLSPEANLRLVPQLERMRPGTRIITHQYPIEGYKPALKEKVAVMEEGMLRDHFIYLYTTPLEKE